MVGWSIVLLLMIGPGFLDGLWWAGPARPWLEQLVERRGEPLDLAEARAGGEADAQEAALGLEAERPRRWRTSGCAQNLPARMRRHGAERGRELVRVVTLHGERETPTRSPSPARRARQTSGSAASAARPPAPEVLLRAARSARSRLVQVLERGRERDRAEHVRGAGLVALGRAVPLDVVERHRRGRAAAPDVGRPRLEEAVGETSTPEPKGRTACGPRTRSGRRRARRARARGAGRAGRLEAELGARVVREPRPARDVGDVPVTFDAPESATILRARAAVEQRREVVGVGVPPRACARGGSPSSAMATGSRGAPTPW